MAKCPKCGNNEFHAHQQAQRCIVVDDSNNFKRNVDTYHADTPFGPYMCTNPDCRESFDELPEESLQSDQKKCRNYCPKCNAGINDIDWLLSGQGHSSAWQNAVCMKCGKEFSEVYLYAFTENGHNIMYKV